MRLVWLLAIFAAKGCFDDVLTGTEQVFPEPYLTITTPVLYDSCTYHFLCTIEKYFVHPPGLKEHATKA